MAAATRKEFAAIRSETRFVQVVESTRPTISLPARVAEFRQCREWSAERFAAWRAAFVLKRRRAPRWFVPQLAAVGAHAVGIVTDLRG